MSIGLAYEHQSKVNDTRKVNEWFRPNETPRMQAQDHAQKQANIVLPIFGCKYKWEICRCTLPMILFMQFK